MASRKALINVHRIIRSTAVVRRSSVTPSAAPPIFQSKQRGFLELDLVLGNWVEENVNSMDETAVKSLIHVLDLENPDLWKWLTSQEQPPEIVSSNPVFLALHKKVMTNLNKHAAPETRAAAGQPWVKGWDDFKRGRDAPISGNQ
ncbi:hypothetical protein Bca101_048539 [Brassica carinata]